MAFKRSGEPRSQHPNGWYPHEAKGRVLRLPSGITVVPYRQHDGYWDAVVVAGDQMYPRGGDDICAFDVDLMAAEEHVLPGADA